MTCIKVVAKIEPQDSPLSKPAPHDREPLFRERELAATARIRAVCDREGLPAAIPENEYTFLAGACWR